ncbi:histidinol-phosphate aminotransferase [Amedibacterium intestinale]|uniref:Histidinol-phosphate aminotransferase n=1 Tax=Amedibacterium intestinale TaxID=2583452 RepID=A0A6N4TJ62_9FIRM|nr:histidinol-phosphate transaminase [Amedibacterium intestinale]BBK22833.1 histidinol-phosphate aminotransferase [Amedibacterium intestinale]
MDKSYKSIFSKNYIDARVYKAPLNETSKIRLYMNENYFGPSPKYKDAVLKIIDRDLYQYQSGGNKMLIEALSEKYKISNKEILITAGSAESISQIFYSILNSSSVVLLPDPGWSYYRGISELLGAKIINYKINRNNDTFEFDVNDLIKKICKFNPKLVVITNPNMPTGNKMEYNDILKVSKYLKNGILLVDEAYIEFSDEKRNLYKCVNKYRNIIITRTFSKFYGLANLRIGYIIANPDIIDLLYKSSDLFGISGISQKIAIECLRDTDYYSKLKNDVLRIRDKFIESINRETSFYAFPSQSNFVLVDTRSMPSDDVVNKLEAEGFLVRDCITYGMENFIRITIGKEEMMDGVFRILKENTL